MGPHNCVTFVCRRSLSEVFYVIRIQIENPEVVVGKWSLVQGWLYFNVTRKTRTTSFRKHFHSELTLDSRKRECVWDVEERNKNLQLHLTLFGRNFSLPWSSLHFPNMNPSLVKSLNATLSKLNFDAEPSRSNKLNSNSFIPKKFMLIQFYQHFRFDLPFVQLSSWISFLSKYLTK